MKKRLVSALLALVLLVGLVPVAASAADHQISEAAITVLKQLTTFKDTCYYVTGSEFRTGYGTVCTQKHQFDSFGKPTGTSNEHKITQLKADTALRTYLKELDKQVNSFASKNSLSLSQNQHDALVVFSHGAGTAWLSGTGALKSAIVSKADTNEMLIVMKNLNDGQFARHQVEVNMYMNGVYSNVIPAQYKSVTYNANGGTIAVGDGNQYTMRFDSSKTVDHIAVTRSGYVFLGWYDAAANGAWMQKLTKDCAGKTLYAYWQNGYNYTQSTGVNYVLSKSDLVSANVYVRPDSMGEKVRDAKGNSITVTGDVTVDQDFIDSSNQRWSHVPALNGWVKVGKPSVEVSTKDVIAFAVVSYNGYLNVRDSAGTDGKIVGALAKNDTVSIYQIQTVNGHRWGRCDAGWICLTYTNLTMVDGKEVSDAGVTAYAFTGKVSMNVTAYVAPGDSSQEVSFEDDMGTLYCCIPANTSITISNLSIAEYSPRALKATWAKATWKNPEKDKYGRDITVTRSGWIPIADSGEKLGDDTAYGVTLDPVMFTVVSDTTSVRQGAGDASALAFTLNKDSQVEVKAIRLVGENIWGKITVKKAVGTGEETKESRNGWINLASKYVKRTTEVTIDEDGGSDRHNTGLIATVINTDSVRVRKSGSIYATQIGTLSGGSTVRVWESKKDEWYKVDSNKNGEYDYEKDGWVSAKYLNVRTGKIEETTAGADGSGSTGTTDGTGTGFVANTYSGVNVRQGAGTSYGAVGKLLPGTQVEILEIKQSGAAKWGRMDKGWVCMDYISMVKINPPAVVQDPSKGTAVDSLDNLEKTTTTAIYTGKIAEDCVVVREPVERPTDTTSEEYKNYETNLIVRSLKKGTNVTIHELAKVTQSVKTGHVIVDGKDTVTTITSTSYWARINDGWIQNPETTLNLTALDEKVHTLTGSDTLKVRQSATQDSAKIDVLEKGDQVKVTALKIEKDKVWGRIETEEGTGWIRLDYMSEGAYYVNDTPVNQPTAPSEPIIGNGGNTGGFTTTGARYTGKVIRTSELNVRESASTTASKTTTLRSGQALVIYETTIAENMAWGRCDAGWVYLYYVDLVPYSGNGAVDARVVFNDNTVAYSDVNCTTATGTYSRMAVVDIYEIVGKMAKTDLGWVNVDNLL